MRGNVVEASTDGQVEPRKAKAALDIRSQIEVMGKALRVGLADDLLLLVDHAERKAIAPFQDVGDIKMLDQRQPS